LSVRSMDGLRIPALSLPWSAAEGPGYVPKVECGV
jgi:hypothetical protein